MRLIDRGLTMSLTGHIFTSSNPKELWHLKRYVARPKSLPEIREEFTTWLEASQRRPAHFVRFSHSSESRYRLIVLSHLFKRDARLWVESNLFSCQLGERRFSMILDPFEVKTAVDSQDIVFEFTLKEPRYELLANKELTSTETLEYEVFDTRALNALKKLKRELPEKQIREASSASTDYMVLLKALTAPSVATQLVSEDPLAEARLRGVQRKDALLQRSGGILGSTEAARLLGISRQAVDKRRSRGHLIGLTQGRRGYAYPAWQFAKGRTIANLERVLDALSGHDPWMQLGFFLNANDRLNQKSPLEELTSGNVESVIKAALNYGEQGAA